MASTDARDRELARALIDAEAAGVRGGLVVGPMTLALLIGAIDCVLNVEDVPPASRWRYGVLRENLTQVFQDTPFFDMIEELNS